ncbi:tRNA dihydrouridine(20/20a) synthase DusA [Ovoidimarina sediminis]|uniref:tRNA dihydrouridine(20/20a) synthase DusA n=1 Tax=Ovoidimarina sediminis TaxID=3079856 RepID=UPI0029092C06|nr:tRNA dihydrouridine(20/20a) synthase DusA [Rhodophyticola sp. MJ-SS7]MDU8943208.1 tRNA dihydrouridine(20/20a) synthase DusA [Rhodophyticola sp. MJ-SS7]
MPLNAATEAARLSIAPMMDWTDRHCRRFHREISQHAFVYTEMVTAPALVRGGARHLLRFNPAEHPVALQIGGSDPAELATAAAMGADEGYDEINLNVGCPSDRVQSGCFGAVLMERPGLVADCVRAMIAAQPRPVTVKCRIGVDQQNPADVLPDFIARMGDAGLGHVIVHARKAWLSGLSPKENRDVPPLDYPLVERMKAEFPEMRISINGGIASLAEAEAFLARGLDGVMIGRAAYHTPMEILGAADGRIFGDARPPRAAHDVARAMIPHIEAHLAEGGRLHAVTRHMLGLFAGRPGARVWRRMLSEGAHEDGAGPELIEEALARIPEARAA